MPFKILVFVLPLGLDTLAIAIALGLRGVRPWRPALLFTAFETLMPVFGIALSRVVGARFETAAVVIGGLLLIALGIHAVFEAYHGEEDAERVSFASLRSTLLAGVAISTDELAAGFPLGVSGLPIGLVLLVIAVQTFLVTMMGVAVGNRVRSRVARGISRYAGIAAGVVFALVGVWLIAERLSPKARHDSLSVDSFDSEGVAIFQSQSAAHAARKTACRAIGPVKLLISPTHVGDDTEK